MKISFKGTRAEISREMIDFLGEQYNAENGGVVDQAITEAQDAADATAGKPARTRRTKAQVEADNAAAALAAAGAAAAPAGPAAGSVNAVHSSAQGVAVDPTTLKPVGGAKAAAANGKSKLPTLEQVVASAQAVIAAKGSPVLRELLAAKFAGVKASALKPEQFEAFVSECAVLTTPAPAKTEAPAEELI